jgi:hypothetical protein
MHPAFEVEGVVRDYLERKLTLDDLRNWFLEARPLLLALPPETRPAEIATLLELGLHELKQGAFSERQFRMALRRLLGATVNVTVDESVGLATTSSVTTQLSPVTSGPESQSVTLSYQWTPTGTSS